MAKSSKIGFSEGLIITINTMIGPGFLLLPFAFSSSGILLSIFMQILISFCSFIVSSHILQTIWRVKYINKKQQEGQTLVPLSINHVFSEEPQDFFVKTEPLLAKRVEPRFDFAYMVNLFLGPTLGTFFSMLIAINLTSGLIVYSILFGSTMVSVFSLSEERFCNIYDHKYSLGDDCWVSYWTYLGIFHLLTLTAALLGIKEQKTLQTFMSVYRVVVMVLMFFTSLYSIIEGETFKGEPLLNDEKLFDISNIGVTLSVIFTTNYFHSTIPSIIECIKNKKKNSLLIFKISVVLVAAIFICIGALIPYAFNGIQKTANIHWIDFPNDFESLKGVLGSAVKYLIVLFPAFTAFSLYPVFAITLSNNLLSIFKLESSRTVEYSVKIAISCTSLVISCFFFDLGQIFNVIGTFFMIEIGFFVPLMAICASKIVKEKGYCDNMFTYEGWAWLIVFIFTGIFCISWYTLIFVVWA